MQSVHNFIDIARSLPAVPAAGCVRASGRLDYSIGLFAYQSLHCKKRLTIFLSPAGMSLTNLSLTGKNFATSFATVVDTGGK